MGTVQVVCDGTSNCCFGCCVTVMSSPVTPIRLGNEGTPPCAAMPLFGISPIHPVPAAFVWDTGTPRLSTSALTRAIEDAVGQVRARCTRLKTGLCSSRVLLG
jgi:hypothetical protein